MTESKSTPSLIGTQAENKLPRNVRKLPMRQPKRLAIPKAPRKPRLHKGTAGYVPIAKHDDIRALRKEDPSAFILLVHILDTATHGYLPKDICVNKNWLDLDINQLATTFREIEDLTGQCHKLLKRRLQKLEKLGIVIEFRGSTRTGYCLIDVEAHYRKYGIECKYRVNLAKKSKNKKRPDRVYTRREIGCTPAHKQDEIGCTPAHKQDEIGCTPALEWQNTYNFDIAAATKTVHEEKTVHKEESRENETALSSEFSEDEKAAELQSESCSMSIENESQGAAEAEVDLLDCWWDMILTKFPETTVTRDSLAVTMAHALKAGKLSPVNFGKVLEYAHEYATDYIFNKFFMTPHLILIPDKNGAVPLREAIELALKHIRKDRRRMMMARG